MAAPNRASDLSKFTHLRIGGKQVDSGCETIAFPLGLIQVKSAAKRTFWDKNNSDTDSVIELFYIALSK